MILPGAGEDAAAFWNETFSDRRADGNACGTGDGLLPGTGIAGNRKLPSGAAGPSERTQMSSPVEESSGRVEEVRRENIVRMSAMPNMNEGIINGKRLAG